MVHVSLADFSIASEAISLCIGTFNTLREGDEGECEVVSRALLGLTLDLEDRMVGIDFLFFTFWVEV